MVLLPRQIFMYTGLRCQLYRSKRGTHASSRFTTFLVIYDKSYSYVLSYACICCLLLIFSPLFVVSFSGLSEEVLKIACETYWSIWMNPKSFQKIKELDAERSNNDFTYYSCWNLISLMTTYLWRIIKICMMLFCNTLLIFCAFLFSFRFIFVLLS